MVNGCTYENTRICLYYGCHQFSFFSRSEAQIRLKGYKCKFYDGQWPYTMAEMYSKTDTFRFTLFSRDIMGEEGENSDEQQELKIGLDLCFKKNHYIKTRDSLYIYTGTYGNPHMYYYHVYIPDKEASISVRSSKNDSLFSERSKWLLSQIRLHRKADVYLLNEKGQSCQNPNERNE